MVGIFIRSLPINLKILLCTIAKQENKYIKEFIEHYRNLNIKKIIIYDNNDINGENIEDFLKHYIKTDFIKVINYRGIQQPQTIALMIVIINIINIMIGLLFMISMSFYI